MAKAKVDKVVLSEISGITRAQIRKFSVGLDDNQVRHLINLYYIMQEQRKRTQNQLRSILKEGEEGDLIRLISDTTADAEAAIKKAMDDYTDSHPVGRWLKAHVGIGPVISAGLVAHIDIEKAPTAGHIWAFAGLDPTKKWEKGQKRPFNAALKLLCWHAGQSFMKLSEHPDCYYGHLYKERKQYEVQRNESGGNKDRATALISKYSTTTDAYKHLKAGKLPPAQIDAMARRWAVKIFLSHLHQEWYKFHFGKPAPAPFAIAILGHGHEIKPIVPIEQFV